MEKCLHWRCLSLISTEFQTLSLTTVEKINPAVWPLPTLCSILNFWAATVSCAKSLLTFMSKSLRFVSFLHLSGIISLDFFMPFHHSWKFLPSCPVCRYEITSQSVIFKSEKTDFIHKHSIPWQQREQTLIRDRWCLWCNLDPACRESSHRHLLPWEWHSGRDDRGASEERCSTYLHVEKSGENKKKKNLLGVHSNIKNPSSSFFLYVWHLSF